MGENLWIDLPRGGLVECGLAFQVHKCAPFAFESGRDDGTPSRRSPTANFAAQQLIGPAFDDGVANTLPQLATNRMDAGGKMLGHKNADQPLGRIRSEEHTSELQSLMRISYAVSCLKKNTYTHQ